MGLQLAAGIESGRRAAVAQPGDARSAMRGQPGQRRPLVGHDGAGVRYEGGSAARTGVTS